MNVYKTSIFKYPSLHLTLGLHRSFFHSPPPEEWYLLAKVEDKMLALLKHKEERNDGATFNLAL